MSAKISITVELAPAGNGICATTIVCSAETTGGNPVRDAQEVEKALAGLSAAVLRHIAGGRGGTKRD